jgi:nucleotide-binding universal stress UspA family protein
MKTTRKNRTSGAKTKTGRQSTRRTPVSVKHILVPVDFSETSELAVDHAVSFAKLFNAKITLLNVVEYLMFPNDIYAVSGVDAMRSQFNEESKRQLARMEQRLSNSGLQIKSLIRTGRAAHEAVEAAKDLKVDLIVIGAHGYKGFTHVLLGSTAEKIVRLAPCPVLTVRARKAS